MIGDIIDGSDSSTQTGMLPGSVLIDISNIKEYIQSSNSETVGYDFTQGDRIRFIDTSGPPSMSGKTDFKIVDHIIDPDGFDPGIYILINSFDLHSSVLSTLSDYSNRIRR